MDDQKSERLLLSKSKAMITCSSPKGVKALKIKIWFVGILVVAVAVPVVLPFVGLAWSPINCSYQDIDLHTGRARYITMIYWLPVRSEIKHTAISKALGVASLDTTYGNWRRVNTFSPGVRYSPHHGFHSAFYLIRKLERIWEVEDYDTEARKVSAKEVLKLWTKTNRDSGADDYIANLSK